MENPVGRRKNMAAVNTGGKQRPRGKPFAKGASGNPAGKPRGARNATLMMLDALSEEYAKPILAAVLRKAGAGDMKAAELLLSRLWPARKGRPVLLENMQPIMTASDVVAALGQVTAAVSNGLLSPDEGVAVANIIEAQRRAFETADFELRLLALEKGRMP